MSSVLMQMASLKTPLNHLHNSNNKSSNFFSSTISTNAASAARLRLRCSSQLTADHLQIERRSGNYSPSRWDADFIQSLHSDYKEERHMRRAGELIMQVKMMLVKETDPIRQLELIDELQRLGLSDHFQKEFKEILNSVYRENKIHERKEENDLYSTALAFRLLREHGFHVAQEVLECFKNEKGEFKPNLVDDTRGLLQLYEASFLLTEGESTLELAREFAAKYLQEKLDDEIDDNLSTWIKYSLDIPIHWRIQRANASVWIDAYKKRPDMNPIVLELAMLDLNVVQAQFQDELKQDFRWWRNTSMVEKLPFARDRLVECYFWTTGIVQPRQHTDARVAVGKVNALITTIDDVYDVYGTLEELEQFTEAIRRWDISAIDQLPSYMQLCFLALDNFVNDTAYDVLKEQGFNAIPYLRKSWRDLVEAYLIEAKWYHSGHKPNLEEYLNTSWISIGAAVILTHAFFRVTPTLTKEACDSLYGYHDIVRWSSIILRLADDLGTSVDEVNRGDVPKSIQCYMNDNNASEEEAREHVKWMIGETWKKVNEDRVAKDSLFCKDFVGCAVDLGRMAQYMYHYGDGHGIQHPIIHQQMRDCLFHHFL
ncbi:cineole synthase 1, chloroplastic-like [Salvia hispanica]|uniref:cineole synthase 1, chloroplastic-like n=1 Tax=Salvia hispanica TaxID=49212 RepID=UPI00200921E4|nr:cineole synthase 1, chloroplastic-like [Salvia hispanica]